MNIVKKYWFFGLIFGVIVFYWYKSAQGSSNTVYGPQLTTAPSSTLDTGLLTNIANALGVIADPQHTGAPGYKPPTNVTPNPTPKS
jgi:hypothetical protein